VRVAACVLAAAAALALPALPSAADEGERVALVREAVAAYGEALDTTERDLRLARFEEAARLFAAAARRGRPSADLYANWGNAALQAERLGEAILAYRRALEVDPDHARARQNLAHARTLLPEWVPKETPRTLFDSFFFWHRSLSPRERMRLAAACFAAATLALAASIRWRSGLLRTAAWVPALAWAGLFASLAVDAVGGGRSAVAVVTAPEAVVRAADSIHAPARFSRPLPSGAEVRVLETRDDWLRVSLANGRDGWLRASSVTRVVAPEPSAG
jgi:hypothetical protein